jgi:LPS sulfotransferase NodH
MRLNVPAPFYLVCANPRVGSTLFCEVLKATGLAGWITEPFDPEAEGRLRTEWRFDAPSRASFIQQAVTRSRTPNGVGGAKIMWVDMDGFLSDLVAFENLRQLASGVERFAGAFGECRAVHLSRRNKVRAAISYWLASTTGEWFWYSGASRRPPPEEPDLWTISRLHAEMHAAEIGWPLLLKAAHINSKTIFYEDWIEDPIAGVFAIANKHLAAQLEPSMQIKVALPARQADERTDQIETQWVDLTGGCPSCGDSIAP